MNGGHYIDGKWIPGQGSQRVWQDSASREVTWRGSDATSNEVEQAFEAARKSFSLWSSKSYEERAPVVENFRKRLTEEREALARTIASDTGKPLWEALTEVDAMISKVGLSRQAYEERRSPVIRAAGGAVHATRFKPHGVTGVLSPFNLPGHLAHAHIIPALLAGNTIVWKPSEQAPNVAEQLAALWHKADLPHGTLNMLQGGSETGRHVSASDQLDGLFFTGGFETGKAIHRSFAEAPHKILALEMGGNNPLVVWKAADLDAAAYLTLCSALITSGQRCTCARRLIIKDDVKGQQLLDRLINLAQRVRLGTYRDTPEPFMGPLVAPEARDRVQKAYEDLRHKGAHPLLGMSGSNSECPLLTPGILDVTGVSDIPDQEIFGPLLQVTRVGEFNDAIQEANRSAFGLAAGLLTDSPELFEHFRQQVRAGIINWNTTTTGASGAMPFGGVGLSGNHRSSGYYAADYSAYPIASTEHHRLELPEKRPPGIPTEW